ncbi:hypothetical protein QZM22_21170 [Burkholderia oklahomensis]|nr:hypothetical protein [Burkholderia oklahomensis]
MHPRIFSISSSVRIFLGGFASINLFVSLIKFARIDVVDERRSLTASLRAWCRVFESVSRRHRRNAGSLVTSRTGIRDRRRHGGNIAASRNITRHIIRIPIVSRLKREPVCSPNAHLDASSARAKHIERRRRFGHAHRTFAVREPRAVKSTRRFFR